MLKASTVMDLHYVQLDHLRSTQLHFVPSQQGVRSQCVIGGWNLVCLPLQALTVGGTGGDELVVGTRMVDYESQGTKPLMITIRCTDSDGLYKDATFSVTVTSKSKGSRFSAFRNTHYFTTGRGRFFYTKRSVHTASMIVQTCLLCMLQ